MSWYEDLSIVRVAISSEPIGRISVKIVVACHGPFTQTVFELLKFFFSNVSEFLALLDCVSRAYSMGLCPSSIAVRPSGHMLGHFEVWLTMSTELMESKFIRRPCRNNLRTY